jgi:hypothetical protein
MASRYREREQFIPVARTRTTDSTPRSSGVPYVLFAGRGDRAAPPPSQSEDSIGASLHLSVDQFALSAPPPEIDKKAAEEMMKRLEQQAKVIALQGKKIRELEERLGKTRARLREGLEEDVRTGPTDCVKPHVCKPSSG